MAKPKIFVSHSTKDNAFTTKLVDDLNAAGAEAWMDMYNLGAGRFPQAIDQALSECEWFLLILTKNALESDWVSTEVYAAINLRNERKVQELFFIKADEIKYDDLPPTWRVFNVFDGVSNYETTLGRILDAVGLPIVEMYLAQTSVNHANSASKITTRAPGSLYESSTLAAILLEGLHLLTIHKYVDAINVFDNVLDPIYARAFAHTQWGDAYSTYEDIFSRAWQGKWYAYLRLGLQSEAEEARARAKSDLWVFD